MNAFTDTKNQQGNSLDFVSQEYVLPLCETSVKSLQFLYLSGKLHKLLRNIFDFFLLLSKLKLIQLVSIRVRDFITRETFF